MRARTLVLATACMAVAAVFMASMPAVTAGETPTAAQAATLASKKGKAAVAQQRPLRPGRLYFGAPPTIPHDAGPEMNECLTCHADNASGAPLTPHPTRLRCRSCHVAPDEKAGEFRSSTFAGLAPPERSPRLHAKAPPLVPHQFLLHENCLACHAPGARNDVISTSHPERLRCQQCHVPMRTSAGSFK